MYAHISEKPGSDIRTMCRDIRGRLRQNDITYLQTVLRIMSGRGIIEPEGKGWKIVPDVDFEQAYYAESRPTDPDAIYDYLVQVRSSSTAQIDKALGYDSIRGCYPILLSMERANRIVREQEMRDGREIWIWRPVE